MINQREYYKTIICLSCSGKIQSNSITVTKNILEVSNQHSFKEWKSYWNMAQIHLSYDISWDLQKTNVNLKMLKKLKAYFFIPSKVSMHALLWWNHNQVELFTSNIKLL